MATEEEIRALKRRHSARLLGQRGVVGVGIEKDAEGGYALTVHLAEGTPETLGLPAELEDHPIKYVTSGPFKKF